MSQATRILDRFACDVEENSSGSGVAYDFDLTCDHPKRPNQKSSLARDPDTRGYSTNQMTLRFPKISIVDDPYEYEEFDGKEVPYDYTGSDQDTEIRSELQGVAEQLNGTESFKNCDGRPIGDQHTRKEEYNFFHPHIECRVTAPPEQAAAALGRVMKDVTDKPFDQITIP